MSYVPTNLHKRIRGHAAFLFKSKPAQIGSGVLVELGGRIFVLSAAHILDHEYEISLGQVHPGTSFTIKNKWTDPRDDVGFVELEPSEVRFLIGNESAPYQIGKKQEGQIAAMKPNMALCGFPAVRKQERSHGVEFPLHLITVPIIAPEQWPGPLRGHWNPDRHFLIAYGPKRGGHFLDENKNPMDIIEPFGLSGCAVWYFDKSTENDDMPFYSLVGIQHSWDEFYEVLVGTFVAPLLDRITAEYGITLS